MISQNRFSKWLINVLKNMEGSDVYVENNNLMSVTLGYKEKMSKKISRPPLYEDLFLSQRECLLTYKTVGSLS